jgi:integrase/recombinase XerD
MLIEEVVGLFIHSRKRGTTGARKKARPKTIEYYEETIAEFTGYLSEKGKTSYAQIKKTDILEFLDWMDTQTRPDGQLWSESTKLKILRALRALFRFVDRDDECVAEGLKPWTKALPVIKATPSRKYIPETGDIRKFKAAFNTSSRAGYRDYVAFCLSLDSGARAGELSNLRVDQLKLADKMALMPEEGKTGQRLVPLSVDMVKMLRGWLNMRGKFAKCDYVFVSRSGNKLLSTAMTQAFMKLRRKHGLAHITPHTLRHIFCTHYLKNGGEIGKMMMITGHSSYDVAKGYLHLSKIGGKEMQAELEHASPLKNL